jgi:hypothetical protein
VTCAACEENYPEICVNCSYCEYCCENREAGCGGYEGGREKRTNLVLNQYPLMFHKSERNQFQRNSLKRYISVEIEIDKANKGNSFETLQNTIDKWNDSVVEDGSLVNWPAREINTSPSNGDKFLNHIEELSAGLESIGADCTNACGLHVHIDTSDVKVYDLRRVTILYDRVERALFELCAPRRLNGRYSLVCGHNFNAPEYTEPKMWKRHIYGAVYGAIIMPKTGLKTITRQREDKYGAQDRYRALNLHSFFYRGTIEFRHHEGTTNQTEITNWALTCAHIIEAAVKMTEAQITALPGSGREVLKAIVPTSLHRWMQSKWFDVTASDYDDVWRSIERRREALRIERSSILRTYDEGEQERRLEKLRKARIERLRQRFEGRLISIPAIQYNTVPEVPEATQETVIGESVFCSICNAYH